MTESPDQPEEMKEPASQDEEPEAVPDVGLTVVEELNEVLESVSPETRVEIQSFIIRRFFAGPLPPPEVLAEYEEVLPGLANRITIMAESRQQHLQEMRNRSIGIDESESKADITFERASLYIGSSLVAFIALLGFLAMLAGKDVLGFAVLMGDIAAVLGVLLYVRNHEPKVMKPKEEEKQLPPPEEKKP